MNDKNTTIVIFLLSIGIISAGFLATDIRKKEVRPEEIPETAQSTSSVAQEDSKPEYVMEAPEMPETAIPFEKFTGNVSYTAERKAFNSVDEEVTGLTDKINGKSWLDFETKSYYLSATIDVSNFSTEDEERDAAVQALFDFPEITIEVSGENNEELVFDKEFEMEVPILLTINNVTRSELFLTKITISEEEVSAAGSTKIRLSDFNVTAPTLAKVYSVNDQITVAFDIVGSRGSMLDDFDEVDQE